MVRRLITAVAVLLLVPAVAHAGTGDIARFVLPPGNYGGIPTGPHSLDQLSLYSGLTPLRRNVSMADVNRFYLPDDFKPIGTTTNEPVGRKDVTVTYDSYGIPHIKGTTRAGLMFGTGWVTARDRGLLLSFGRNPARAAVADIPGLDAFSLVTSATSYTPSRQAEALVTQQRQKIVRAYGAEGRQMLVDMANYADGVNAYYTTNHLPIPGGRPFDANDVIAVTAFIGSIFGNGGGAEHENSDLLARLEQKFGAGRGHALWSDAMEANDPDAPTTTRKFFPYPTLTGGKVRGSVVIDPGSIQLAKDPRTGAARDMEPLRRHASNWQQVAASRSATGRPLGVMGPQLGYYYPEIVYQEHLQGPGINAQGVSASGLGLYLLIGRTRDYAWSLTSAGSDNEDVFAEKLCVPGGGRPTAQDSSHTCGAGVPADAELRCGSDRQPGDHLPDDRARPGDRDRDRPRPALRFRPQALDLRPGRALTRRAQGDDRGAGDDATAVLEVRQSVRLHVQLGATRRAGGRRSSPQACSRSGPAALTGGCRR